MGSKRDHEEALDTHEENGKPETQPNSKRRRNQAPVAFKQQSDSKIDPTFGQRPAIGGLDPTAHLPDDHYEWEDENDALTYLSTVRSATSSFVSPAHQFKSHCSPKPSLLPPRPSDRYVLIW